MQFFGPKSIFLPKVSNYFVTIMTGQQKDNIFVLITLQGGPRGSRRGPDFGPKICIFLRYAYITPIFLGRTDPTEWDHIIKVPHILRYPWITSVFR